MKNITTFSSLPNEKALTEDSLQKIIDECVIYDGRRKKNEIPIQKTGWLEKMMNKFGWYRKTTYVVFDKQKMERSVFNSLSI